MPYGRWRGQYDEVDCDPKERPKDVKALFYVTQTVEIDCNNELMPVYSMPIITWLSACKNFMVNPKPSKPYNKATDPITWGASVYIKNYFPKSSWEEWRVLKILNSQDPSNLLLHSTNFKLCLIINASFYHLLQSRLKRRLSA